MNILLKSSHLLCLLILHFSLASMEKTRDHHTIESWLSASKNEQKLLKKFKKIIKEGNLDKVRALIKLGANVNGKFPTRSPSITDTTQPIEGVTPLIIAVKNAVTQGHSGIVELLLENSANVNAMDATNGNTALFYALQVNFLLKGLLHKKRSLEVVSILLKAKANVNIQNKRGRTVLFEAERYSNTPLIDTLISAGADLAIKDRNGMTAKELWWQYYEGPWSSSGGDGGGGS